jgi:hypothetical protein
MEKSLFLTYDRHYEHLHTADNLIVAKILFDEGKPFPKQRIFLADSSIEKSDSFFYEGISLLFHSPICYETDMENYSADDPITFTVAFQAAKEWDHIGRMIRDDSTLLNQYQEDTHWILENVESKYCDYFELQVKTLLTPFGIQVTLDGYHALFHPFMLEYVAFLHRIEKKVREWNEILKGERNHGENSHYAIFGETGYRRKVV